MPGAARAAAEGRLPEGPGPRAHAAHVPLPHWVAAGAPFVALAVLVRGLGRPAPWAVLDAGILAAAVGAHAVCYAVWQPFAPRRILLNELLARLWFAGYAILVAHWLGRDVALATGMAPALAATSWALHAALVRRRGYGVLENALHLGLYLLGLAGVLHAA